MPSLNTQYLVIVLNKILCVLVDVYLRCGLCTNIETLQQLFGCTVE